MTTRALTADDIKRLIQTVDSLTTEVQFQNDKFEIQTSRLRMQQQSLEVRLDESSSLQKQLQEKVESQSLAKIAAAAHDSSATEAHSMEFESSKESHPPQVLSVQEVQQQTDPLSLMGQAPGRESILENQHLELRIMKLEEAMMQQRVEKVQDSARQQQMEKLQEELRNEVQILTGQIATLSCSCEFTSKQTQKVMESNGVVLDEHPVGQEPVEVQLDEGGHSHSKDPNTSSSVILDGFKYEFNASIWDACLFIGTQHVGILGSILMVVLLVINIAMQALYTIIVYVEFTQPTYDKDTVAAYHQFRVRVAHDIKYIDPITQVSLAAKICSGDPTLEVAGQQMDALSSINGYLSNSDSGEATMFGEAVGQIMCWLACMTWTMVVAKEIVSCIKLSCALCRHASENGLSWFTRVICNGEICHINELGVIMASVLILRLVAAVFLLFSGLEWLVHETSLKDLVLNAVALECVLSLDELIFEAFAPAQMAIFLGSLEGLPLPRRAGCICHGLDMHSILGLLGSAGLLLYLIPPWLSEEIQRLSDARDALCGGDRNSVFASTQFPPFDTWSATEMPDTSQVNEFAESLTTSIKDRNPSSVALNIMQPTVLGTAWSVKSLSGWLRDKATSKYNGLCKNLFDFEFLREALGLRQSLTIYNSEGAGSCEDMRKFCDEDSQRGGAARGICPVACGCDRPDSELVLSARAGGCPRSCQRLDVYQHVLATANPNCTDRSLDDLQEDPTWNRFARQVFQIAVDANWEPFFLPVLENYRDKMLQHGCAAVQIMRNEPGMYSIDLCDEDEDRSYPYKSVRLFCPVSCNCTSSALNCPTSCPSA